MQITIKCECGNEEELEIKVFEGLSERKYISKFRFHEDRYGAFLVECRECGREFIL